MRQGLLTQSLQGQALADFRHAAERPSCPACGALLLANGQRKRQMVTQQVGVDGITAPIVGGE